jgi:hypothetical protein
MLTILILAAISGAVSADSRPCGSRELAQDRLQAVLRHFTPGVSFKELCEQVQPPADLPEYWGAPPREGLLWILSGRDGSRVATHTLVCAFDAEDHLVLCTEALEPQEIQEVEVSSFEDLEIGASPDLVVSRLCEPGTRHTSSDGETVFEYLVHRPKAVFNQWCPGYIAFRARALTEKTLTCK